MSKEKRKGVETPRRKQNLPAKAGRRHIRNINHPRPRSHQEAREMRKEVR